MSTPVKEASRRSRNPDGCTEAVMAHLTPAERQQLDRKAKREMRSLSATIRLLIVQGLQQQES